MEELLGFEEVSFAYNGLKAIEQLTLLIKEGEFVGVVGPNGSGKTTFLKLACGVLKPQTGQVFLENEDLSSYSRPQIASKIAVVPQSFNLEFNFTVEEVVRMGNYSKKKLGGKVSAELAKVEKILKEMDLLEMRERFFSDLSGGEKQRAILAQALAQEPKILLLDEPASNLDVSFQLKLFDFLKKLNEEGMTIVCVVHDLNIALSYFEKIVLLYKGKIVTEGPTEEVLQPALIERVYGVKAVLHKHSGKSFLTFSPPPATLSLKGKVHLICGGGTGSFLMRELTNAGFLVTAGVINALDTDEFTGRELGLGMAVEAPFSSISDSAFLENQDLIKQADIVVLTDVPIGEGNIRNLEALKWAVKIGKEVWIIGKDLENRDFSGRAKQVFDLVDKAKFFDDERDVLNFLVENIGRKNG